MPFLSVIVPIYKVEKYLVQCVDSIINQTFTDIEIILVDDGGQDACPSICDAYASKDSRVKVIHKDNGGLVSARKAGLQVATGEYIAYVDGDDSIDENMYLFMYNAVRESNADIVAQGFKFCYPDKIEIWQDKIEDGIYDKEALERSVYPVMMCHNNTLQRNVAPAIWNKIFRRELLQQVMPAMDERIKDGEDAAVTYPCFLLAEKVVFMTSEQHYNYRINYESMSRSFDEKWYVSASHYCEWMDRNITEHFEDMRECVNLEKFMMLYRYVNREYLHGKEKCKNYFAKRLSMICEETAVGKSIRDVNISKLKIPMFGKIQYFSLKYKCYTLCKFCCWCYCKIS